jgi:DivIVA domain-containing protein
VPIVLLLVAVAVVVAIAVVAAGFGDSMAEVAPDRDGAFLPQRELRRADVDALRFSVGLRGYRMDEVDDVLDRLCDELAQRDARIGELERTVRDARGDAGTTESINGAATESITAADPAPRPEADA